MKRIFGYATLLVLFCSCIARFSAAQNENGNSEVIRLAIVITPEYSGLIDFLVEDGRVGSLIEDFVHVVRQKSPALEF